MLCALADSSFTLEQWLDFVDQCFEKTARDYFSAHVYNDPHFDARLIFIVHDEDTNSIVSTLRVFVRQSVGSGGGHGLWAGIAYSAVDTYLFGGKAPWTLSHHAPDHACTLPLMQVQPKVYPKADNKITFDLLTSVSRSGTNHRDGQPVHLTLMDAAVPTMINRPKFGGPEAYFCPAGVYEYHEDGAGGEKLVINGQNCVHCKTCDIKDPTQNINWVAPEGGDGPAYPLM